MKWLGTGFLTAFCLLVVAYVYVVEYRGTGPADDDSDASDDDTDVTRRSQ